MRQGIKGEGLGVTGLGHGEQQFLLGSGIRLHNLPNIKIQEKSQISFCKILKNKWYHEKVLLKRFHLNGHIIGFCPQI